MKRCLVTGASGHLGAYLVKELLARGAQVYVMVRPQSDLWRLADVRDKVKFIYSDLIDLNEADLDAAHVDTVFHLAWQNITAAGRDDAAQITMNTTATLKLFDVVLAGGCMCWVGVGSLAEYGAYNRTLTEDLHPRPITAYGTAKLCIGLLIHKLCELSEMRYVWFRMTGTYGPMDHPDHLIPSVINTLMAGEKPALTPGEQLWDYLYIEDAAIAIAELSAMPEASGVFNLGSGTSYSVRETAEMIRDLIDPALPLGFGELPYAPKQIMHLEADITRLQQYINWQPHTTLAEGLRLTVEKARL